ncbi:MAG: ROK family protein [Corynebacterium sp.]|nr:ROK family protein [Corynebacterium sp.]
MAKNHTKESYSPGHATVAVDIGGTKIAAGVVESRNPREVYRIPTRPTNAHEGGEAVFRAVCESIEAVMTHAQEKGWTVVAIGIAAPGVINPRTGVVEWSFSHMPGWMGMKLGERLNERFGIPIAVDNDVRIMGLGEALYGNPEGPYEGSSFFLSMGTGANGTYVYDGACSNSGSGVRSEFGFAACPDLSGGIGNLYSVGSGGAIEHHCAEAEGTPVESLKTLMPKIRVGQAPRAAEVFDRSVEYVGIGIGNVINMHGAERIVLGGGIGTLPETLEPFTRGVRESVIEDFTDIPIYVARLGTDAPLIGAAYIARLEEAGLR